MADAINYIEIERTVSLDGPILPEALRGFANYRMLIYAIVLILVMLATNNPQLRALVGRLIPRRKEGTENG